MSEITTSGPTNKALGNNGQPVGLTLYLICAGSALGGIFIIFLIVKLCQVRLERIRRAIRLRLLTPDQLNIIGEFLYTKDADRIVQECSICITAFRRGDACRTLPPPCNHTFHTACIDKWFDKSSLCPLCKRDMHDNFHEQSVMSPLGVIKSEDIHENQSLFYAHASEGGVDDLAV